jgi:[methyl-Co(III) methanol-specific corrinoid protein]:coenzyme M methyltransferase
MNSRERFLAAMAGAKPDRPPLAHVSALTTLELQQTTGCFMPEVHADPEKLVRLAGANHDLLGFDAASFIINYFNEPAALGCEMSWGGPDELPVYKSHPWARAEDAVAPADLLDRPPIRRCLETLRLAKERYGTRAAILGKVMGPFSMTLVMHGLENVLAATVEAPDLVSRFLEVAAEILAVHANAQLAAGADAVAIGEGGAGASMLSPAAYERLLLPVHQRMVRAIRGPTIMHICGDITPRLAAMKRVGMTCFNFDWAIRPAAMKEAAGGAMRLMGNVNTGDLARGTPGEIERQVFENLDAGIDIISPGCAVSPKCPNVNLRAMAEAIAKWEQKRR